MDAFLCTFIYHPWYYKICTILIYLYAPYRSRIIDHYRSIMFPPFQCPAVFEFLAPLNLVITLLETVRGSWPCIDYINIVYNAYESTKNIIYSYIIIYTKIVLIHMNPQQTQRERYIYIHTQIHRHRPCRGGWLKKKWNEMISQPWSGHHREASRWMRNCAATWSTSLQCLGRRKSCRSCRKHVRGMRKCEDNLQKYLK